MLRQCLVLEWFALLLCASFSGAFIPAHQHITRRTDYDFPWALPLSRDKHETVSSPTGSSLTQTDLGKLTIPQLTEQLRFRGLKVSGRKDELIERLMEVQAPDDDEKLLSTAELDDNASFESLGLSREVLSAVRSQPAWTSPTPIQQLAVPRLLDSSTDSIWCEAPTGSGKTAAYVLPLLEKLRHQKGRGGRIASVLLCPTRELAVQIGSVVRNLTNNVGGRKRWNISVVHGGVPLEPQIVELSNAVRDDVTIDVLVATPGRLYDVLTYYDNSEEETARTAALERRLLDALDSKRRTDASLSLTQIEGLKLDELVDDGRTGMKELLQGLEFLVLDEADRLLGGAFETELDSLLDVFPAQKLNTWFFSATFPKQIEPRADYVLKRVCGSDASPVRISCLASDRVSEDDISGRLQKRLKRVAAHPTLQQVGPASTIQLRTIRLELPARTQALRRLLEENEEEWDRVLVFVATRYASQHVARKLRRVGISSAELHGKLDQTARLKRLSDFRKGKIRVLLATDVASRGLDIVGLPAVINYDLPRSTADFVHRVGRTGRAGRSGMAVSFVTPVNEAQLDLIEKRHLVEPVEREVLPGFEPNEEEWTVKSEASRISAPGTVHSRLGLAHDRMHGGVKGRRKSKKDRLREQAAREAAAKHQQS